MSGIKVTNERPARPIPDTSSVEGVVDDENVDWDPPTGGTVENDQWKQPVRVATTATITIATALNAGDTIDGVTLVAGDRVLVKDQSAPAQNGIYIAGATPERAVDLDDDDEVLGAVVYVIAGTANAGTTWAVTNTAATVIDTDPIDWAAFTGGGATSIEVDDDGTPLTATVASIDFVGAGVTATAVGDDVTVTIPGGASVAGEFNIDDYGAVGDAASISDADIAAATDDTVAVQDAIDACIAAGGGDIVIPARIFAIKGALVDTSTFNSQLKIPTVSFSDPPIAIRFRGVGPNTTYGGVLTPGHGAILRSDWNGSISGNPAIISAGKYRDIPTSASNVMVSFEDLVIVAHDDPKLTAIQMTCASNVRRKDVQIRAVTAAPSAVPTHANAAGYEGPWGLVSTVPDYAIGFDIYGFYTGYVPSEQDSGTVGIAFCTRAVLFEGGSGSPTYIHYPNNLDLVITQCPRAMVFATDTRWVNIRLSLEHDTGIWAPVYDVDDASNLGYGHLTYQVIDYAGGVGTAYDIILNGGKRLAYTNLILGGVGPWIVQVSAVTLPAYNNTNFGSLNLDSGELLGGDLESSGAQNDEIEWKVVTSAGLWSFDLLHYKGNNRGIYTVYVDGVSVGTIDGYAAGATKNVVSSINSIAIAGGAHTVKLKMATKNGSSSNYFGTIQSWQLRRTS